MQYSIYGLAILVIPFITEWLNDWNKLPPRLIAWLPIIMGTLTTFFTHMAGGMTWADALWAIFQGLIVGSAATQGRQLVVKSILKKPTLMAVK